MIDANVAKRAEYEIVVQVVCKTEADMRKTEAILTVKTQPHSSWAGRQAIGASIEAVHRVSHSAHLRRHRLDWST